MSIWIWVIILVAVVGAFILEYQKTKMRVMTRSRQNEKEVDELRKLIDSLKTRIENLEAIAAGEPETFSEMPDIEITGEMEDAREENRQKVSDLANKDKTES